MAAVLGLALAGAAGCKNSEPPAPPPVDPARVPAVVEVKVTEVQLGSALGADKRVAQPKTAFSTKDTIFAPVATDGTANATEIAAKWTFQDGQVVNESKKSIPRPARKSSSSASRRRMAGPPAATRWRSASTANPPTARPSRSSSVLFSGRGAVALEAAAPVRGSRAGHPSRFSRQRRRNTVARRARNPNDDANGVNFAPGGRMRRPTSRSPRRLISSTYGLFAVVVGLVGCPAPQTPPAPTDGAPSDTAVADVADQSRSPVDAAPAEVDTGGNADSGGSPPPVWTADSVGFRLERQTCGSGCNHENYQNREPSFAQRAALGALTLVPADKPCSADGWSATLTIFDRGGVKRVFRWRPGHEVCFGPWLLDERAYQALITAVPNCSQPGPLPAGGCLRSIPFAVPAAPVTLSAKGGETWAIFLADCEGLGTVRLLDPSGSTVIARGARQGDDCSRIQHTFTADGVWIRRDRGWGLLGSLKL